MRDETPYTIDRLEGEDAVLMTEDGRELTIPHRHLPGGLREGTVLRVPIVAGRPDWSLARIDRISTEQRWREAAALLKDVKKRDPGGDVRL